MVEESALISATFIGIQQYAEKAQLLTEKMIYMTTKEKVQIFTKVQLIANHIEEYVEQLTLISKLDDKIIFNRGEIVRLVKRIVVLLKNAISLEFVLNI